MSQEIAGMGDAYAGCVGPGRMKLEEEDWNEREKTERREQVRKKKQSRLRWMKRLGRQESEMRKEK